MTVTTLAPPAAEPVRLDDVRAYLRIGHTNEDGLVADLVAAARARIEALTGLALINRTIRVRLDEWPAAMARVRRYALPVRPAAELIAVKVIDASGDPEDVAERFELEAGRSAHLVWSDGALPRPWTPVGGVEIDYVAGFGDAPEDVDESLILAVMRLTAHAYLARDAQTLAGALPGDVAELLAPWRRVRL
ncbi:MAG: hypothetical protein R3C52_05025 [Hyphomonadaceae bacterium]